MGLLRLRARDIDLARATDHRDIVLDQRRDARDLLTRWHRQAEAMGVRIVAKSSLFGRLSKIGSTYYRQIRLGAAYLGKPTEWQAVILGHEMVHARQWRGYTRKKFRTRYLFRPRWRWAIEVQAYAESVRILVSLGAAPDTVDRYIDGVTSDLWRSYGLRAALRKHDVCSQTVCILLDAQRAARYELRRR